MSTRTGRHQSIPPSCWQQVFQWRDRATGAAALSGCWNPRASIAARVPWTGRCGVCRRIAETEFASTSLWFSCYQTYRFFGGMLLGRAVISPPMNCPLTVEDKIDALWECTYGPGFKLVATTGAPQNISKGVRHLGFLSWGRWFDRAWSARHSSNPPNRRWRRPAFPDSRKLGTNAAISTLARFNHDYHGYSVPE